MAIGRPQIRILFAASELFREGKNLFLGEGSDAVAHRAMGEPLGRFFAFLRDLHIVVRSIAEGYCRAADRAEFNAIRRESSDLVSDHFAPHDRHGYGLALVQHPRPCSVPGRPRKRRRRDQQCKRNSD